jgi:hypothetical protein
VQSRLQAKTTSDMQDLAGDLARLVRTQETHGARHILGLAQATERDLSQHLVPSQVADTPDQAVRMTPGDTALCQARVTTKWKLTSYILGQPGRSRCSSVRRPSETA